MRRDRPVFIESVFIILGGCGFFITIAAGAYPFVDLDLFGKIYFGITCLVYWGTFFVTFYEHAKHDDWGDHVYGSRYKTPKFLHVLIGPAFVAVFFPIILIVHLFTFLVKKSSKNRM